MNWNHRLAMLPLLALSLLAAGCGDDDDPTGPDEIPSGSVTFAYNLGGSAGSYVAVGAVRLDDNDEPEYGTWAAAGRSGNELGVVAFQARPPSRGDAFVLFLPDATGSQTIQIEEDCDPEADDCAVGVLVFGTTLDETDEEFDHLCFLVSGTVNLSSVSNDRVQGTFSGQGVCLGSNFIEQPLTITNGTFNVPVVDELGAGL